MSLIQEACRLSLNATSKAGVARALGVSESALEDAIYKQYGTSFTTFKDQRQRINRLTRVRNLRVAELVSVHVTPPTENGEVWLSYYDDQSAVLHAEGKPTRYLEPEVAKRWPIVRGNHVPHWLLLDLMASARRYHHADYVKLTTSELSLDGLQRMVIPSPTLHEDTEFVVRYLQSLGLPIQLTDIKPAIAEHAAINLVAAEGSRWTGRARVFLHRR